MIKRILLVAATLLTLVGGGVFVASGTAAADDDSEFPSCEQANPAGVGPAYGGGIFTGDGDWYAYGPAITTKSWSACEDINITWQFGDGWRWRVRFYPSSGGSYVNSWKVAPCPNYCKVVVATNVSNGTLFRMEGHKLEVGDVQSVYQRPMDMRW